MEKQWRPETVAVQGSYRPGAGEVRIPPIYQSTGFFFDEPGHVADLFDLKTPGHMYSRISNPGVAYLEEKIALLEGGVGAVATSSGQAAIAMAILNICGAGQHIVASSALYGGTYTLLDHTLRRWGIEVSFVSPAASVEEMARHFRPETRLLLAETIGNPGLGVLDFAKFAQVAREMQVPLLIDNTFATPYLCRPLEQGANLVVHSTTKYLDGHATSVGGVIVDGGNFDWNNGKYPELCQPDPAYHGICYWNEFGKKAYITKARVQLLRDLGACMSPFNAFLTNLGIETLALRMERHSQNAQELAQFLQKHPQVTRVNYPGLPDSTAYGLARKYLPHGASGVLTFNIRGGAEAGKRFISRLQLASLVVHVGDLRTLVLQPSTTTHSQLTPEQQEAAGVSPDMIRVSVGIEAIEDLKADFAQALE